MVVIGLDPIEKVTEDAFDTMMATNVKGLLNVTQAVLPGMKQRKEGHIINMSSIAGTEAYASGGVYWFDLIRILTPAPRNMQLMRLQDR